MASPRTLVNNLASIFNGGDFNCFCKPLANWRASNALLFKSNNGILACSNLMRFAFWRWFQSSCPLALRVIVKHRAAKNPRPNSGQLGGPAVPQAVPTDDSRVFFCLWLEFWPTQRACVPVYDTGTQAHTGVRRHQGLPESSARKQLQASRK